VNELLFLVLVFAEAEGGSEEGCEKSQRDYCLKQDCFA
jgi:hypothetical protein